MTTRAPANPAGVWETAQHAVAQCDHCGWTYGSIDAGEATGAGRQHAEEHPAHVVDVEHAHHYTFRFAGCADVA